jgi:hypothetical protein
MIPCTSVFFASPWCVLTAVSVPSDRLEISVASPITQFHDEPFEQNPRISN